MECAPKRVKKWQPPKEWEL